jgi:hypothetical protein
LQLASIAGCKTKSVEVFSVKLAWFQLEWIDIANTEYRYTAIRIPVNTGIPVFLTCFF